MIANGQVLNDKICFVTGAGRGIGKRICLQFAQEGAVVYANLRQESRVLEWLEGFPEEYRERLVPVCFDITDTPELKKCFQQIHKERGRLDVLVNNAGITGNEMIGMIREETVRRLFETNVFAAIQALQMAARLMKKNQNGSIINISSVIGQYGAPYEIVYSGTKGAMIAITKSASKELASDGIRVNSVAPGYADTDMFHNAASGEEKEQEIIGKIGLRRLAKPDDIAQAVTFLASGQASYITGQILGVNGGTII